MIEDLKLITYKYDCKSNQFKKLSTSFNSHLSTKELIIITEYLNNDSIKYQVDQDQNVQLFLSPTHKYIHNVYEEENHYRQTILDSVLNSSVDLIFYKDYKDEDGRYIGCNDAFGKFVGKSKEEIIGKNDIELFGEEVGSFFREKDKDVVNSKTNISNEEWVTYPSGEEVLLHTTKSVLKDKYGKFIGILGISRDMTMEFKYKQSLLLSDS